MGNAKLSHLTAIGTQKKEKTHINKGTINHIYNTTQPSFAFSSETITPVETLIAQANVNLKKSYCRDIAIPYLLHDSIKHTLYNCYVPLTLIQKEEYKAHERQFTQGNRKPEEKGTPSLFHYDLLYQQDAPIEVSDLWEPARYALKQAKKHAPDLPTTPINPRRLVICGAAGMGKTTMLRCIAAHWGREDSANQEYAFDIASWRAHFDIVLHLSLRSLLTYESALGSKAERAELMVYLADWLEQQHHCLRQDQAHLLVSLLDSLEQDLLPHSRLLLLLDGFDEVSSLLNDYTPLPSLSHQDITEAKKHHTLRQQLLKHLLSHTDWLLTTRPHLAECPWLVGATHHLALTGFSPKHIQSYVERFYRAFNKTELEAQAFLRQLKQPELQALSRVPLQLELLCSVGLVDYDNPLESTTEMSLTQLYAKMLLILCKRFLQKQPSYLQGYYLDDLSSRALITHCRLPLQWLSNLALEAMLSQKTALNLSSLAKDHSLRRMIEALKEKGKTTEVRKALEGFGVLTATSGLVQKNLWAQTYYFQHLTYQEFLAAWMLARKLMTCALEERPAIIKRIQDPFYHRMQVFLVSLLSEPAVFPLFFNREENRQRRAVVYAILHPIWKVFLGSEIQRKGLWKKNYSSLTFIHACRLLTATLSDPVIIRSRTRCATSVRSRRSGC
ncbi:MAG: NACHT domain-containing protein [Gammaproteobacteria bacterium]|nr:NACHT domain-containing protein [Gammaproteobacteria bacterium]